MTLAEVAKMWQSHGVSCIPILAKNRPAIRWKDYQTRIPNLGEVSEWWGNGHPYGIAIICGAVSGGLEMTEIEGRAQNSAALTDIANAADSLGCSEAWDLVSNGYTQGSPSGGLHMVYRISDHEVPGNEKIALDADGIVLAETRGEGGYFVGAPSPGSCHPSGEGWLLASGEYGVVPEITWAQRLLIHEALRLALDETPAPTAEVARIIEAAPLHQPSPERRSGAASLRPGEAWAEVTDWADILVPEGWTFSHKGPSGSRFWCRPGKSPADGHSASTDFEGKPGLFIWSTSTGLATETPHGKAFVYAHYRFNGNFSACASYLRSLGFGDSGIFDLTGGEYERASLPAGSTEEAPRFSLDEAGNGARLWHQAGYENFRYVHEEKQVYCWSGTRWEPDHKGALERAWIHLTYELEKQGVDEGNQAMQKWARASRSMARINSACSAMRLVKGATISATEMNTSPEHLNLINGTYNISTKELEPHTREHLMTRTMKAAHNPKASCPKFEGFMEQVLPDPEVRRYVQRAVGYSLLGRADRRAFFLIYGPSGTGKSQFLSTMEHVFGHYGGTAAEGTFRTKDNGGANNDLHGLRGKRFVSTSETAENATFNENLLKRLTGRDKVVSRDLYQSNIEWTPECALWLATNHPPRFNSDDDAIWKRAKLVPFLTRFGTDVPDIPDYAREHLYDEADGILNWILAGLHDFLDNGLGEPEAVTAAAADHRSQSDSVVRFLEDQLADGVLVEAPTGSIRTKELFAMYEEWSRTSGERGLGSRRFIHRLESSGRATYSRTNAHSVWRGLHRPGAMAWTGQSAVFDNSDK